MGDSSVKPPSVFDYLDYRELLRDRLAARREENPAFSLRYVAGKTGLSASLLTRVLKGQRNLNPAAAVHLAKVFGFQDAERDFLETLILFGQAKSHAEKNHFLDKILRIRATKVRTLGEDKAGYFRTWYHSALRELLNFYPFVDDYGKLARMLRPAIKVEEARKAMKFLIEAGMVERQADGTYRLTEAIVSSGDKIRAQLVNNLHISMAELAIRAIQEMQPVERDFSSLTLSLSPNTLEAVKARIRKFRKEILEMARQDEKVSGVYQVNFQVFPLSHHHPGGSA
jgi:uncharacterized protein (TIGR02147 family)